MILDWNLFGNSVFKRTIRMFIRHSPCGFRLLRNLFLCIIHGAEDNVVFPVFQVMIIADDNVVFTIFQVVSCTNNSTPFDIRSGVCKTTHGIVRTHVRFRALQCITSTKNLRPNSIIGIITVAQDRYSTATGFHILLPSIAHFIIRDV